MGYLRFSLVWIFYFFSGQHAALASDMCLDLFKHSAFSGPRVTEKTRNMIAAAFHSPAEFPVIIADRLYRRLGVRAEPSRLAQANPKQPESPYSLSKVQRLLMERAPHIFHKNFDPYSDASWRSIDGDMLLEYFHEYLDLMTLPFKTHISKITNAEINALRIAKNRLRDILNEELQDEDFDPSDYGIERIIMARLNNWAHDPVQLRVLLTELKKLDFSKPALLIKLVELRMLYVHTPLRILADRSETLGREFVVAIEKAVITIDELTPQQQAYIFSISEKDPQLRNVFRFSSKKLIPPLHLHLVETLKQTKVTDHLKLKLAWDILQYFAYLRLERDLALETLKEILLWPLNPQEQTEFVELKNHFESI